jgi:tetratricopeptide (TPR) repeat protein
MPAILTLDIDLLIERFSPEARTLLWVVTRAGEPTTEDMIGAVWGAAAAPLLSELCGAGLLVREGKGSYSFRELVAERVAAWMERHPSERSGRTEVEVWKAYGERYGEAFNALLRSGQREPALEAGRRGIRYLVRAHAFESLWGFAGVMVTSTNDPSLLGPVIADLQVVVGEVPAGEARWKLRTYLADALHQAGRPNQSLPLYALAAEEAEAAEHWMDVGWICQNWASAFMGVGQLERARETYLRSAEVSRRIGGPRIEIVASELEALRVEVKRGRAEDALPIIEEKLTEVRNWWARLEKGEGVPEVPNGESLARALKSCLDVATEANLQLKRWQAALDLQDEVWQVKRVLGESKHELARTRFNTYGPLIQLEKLGEAKAVLDSCLEIFREAGDVMREGMTLSALANVWYRLGDPLQSVALERRALALRERLPNPEHRATSHDYLAVYLYETGLVAEAPSHRLAALTYRIATGFALHVSLHNFAVDMLKAADRDQYLDLPRLVDILKNPAFASLRAFLGERSVAADKLQAAIDDLNEQIRASDSDLSFQDFGIQWPGWAWLRHTLRNSGLDPASARKLAKVDPCSSWVILAKPSELLQQHFDLQSQVLVLCAPVEVIQVDDIERVEKLFAENPRVDPGFALVMTADPDAGTRLAPILPDDRRYLFVRDEAFRTAPDPQAFLFNLLRDGLGRRRLFDFRLPAGEWQFFGREKELEALERDVLNGHCLGVFGLRKVGKTSLLRRMVDKFRKGDARRVVPVEVDLQTTSYLRRNLEGVAERIGAALDHALNRAQIQVPATPSHPLERLRAVATHVERALGTRVLLILDEYEVLLGGKRIPRSDGVALLTWLRGLAQEHPRGFSFVLVGRNQKLLAPARIDDADNPMYRFLRSVPIAGLVPEDCQRMVRALGGRLGLRFERDALDLFVQETGGHPALVRTLGDLVDVHIPMPERNPAIVHAAKVRDVLPRFSRAVDEDMRELVNAANDFDSRADDYLAHLAHDVPWIGGPPEARIDDALVGYGILHPDTHEFRIGHLLTWLRENYGSPARVAHG